MKSLKGNFKVPSCTDYQDHPLVHGSNKWKANNWQNWATKRGIQISAVLAITRPPRQFSQRTDFNWRNFRLTTNRGSNRSAFREYLSNETKTNKIDKCVKTFLNFGQNLLGFWVRNDHKFDQYVLSPLSSVREPTSTSAHAAHARTMGTSPEGRKVVMDEYEEQNCRI